MGWGKNLRRICARLLARSPLLFHPLRLSPPSYPVSKINHLYQRFEYPAPGRQRAAYPRLRDAYGGEFRAFGERGKRENRENKTSKTHTLCFLPPLLFHKLPGEFSTAGPCRCASGPDAHEHRRAEQSRLGLRVRARRGARWHVREKRKRRERERGKRNTLQRESLFV